MLGSHSKCICTPESQFKIEMLNNYYQLKKDDLLSVFRTIKDNFRFKIWGINIEPDINEGIWSSYSELIMWIVQKYSEINNKKGPKFWIDHTASNIKYATVLFNLFHNAKMVHIIRDGRAVASSVIPLDWGPNTIENAAHWWLGDLSYGFAAESFFKSNQIIRVKYEDLVINPETTLKTLCTFLDIEYEPDMVKGNGFKVPEFTVNQHCYVGKKPNTKRIDSWKRELTSRQIEIFESLTYDILTYLGYDLMYGLKANPPSFIERKIFMIVDFYRKQTNKIVFRNRVNKHTKN